MSGENSLEWENFEKNKGRRSCNVFAYRTIKNILFSVENYQTIHFYNKKSKQIWKTSITRKKCVSNGVQRLFCAKFPL